MTGLEYWAAYRAIALASVDAKWGLKGLFIRGEANPYRIEGGEEQWDEALAEYRKEYKTAAVEKPTSRHAIDSAGKLRSLCRVASKYMRQIARWQGWYENPPSRDFWVNCCPKLSPEVFAEFIREVWEILKACPGRGRPRRPRTPLNGDDALAAMDDIIAWCEVNNGGTEESQKTSKRRGTRSSAKSGGRSLPDVVDVLLPHLMQHHQYQDGVVALLTPVEPERLPEELGVSRTQISRAFDWLFAPSRKPKSRPTGYQVYQRLLGSKRLGEELRKLSGESIPYQGTRGSMDGLSRLDPGIQQVDDADELEFHREFQSS